MHLIENSSVARAAAARPCAEDGGGCKRGEAGKLGPEPRFDVLLTDLMLPGIAGTDLAVGLRERWPGLRVIFTSGYAGDEELRREIRLGGHFLQKPFDMETLSSELRQVLDEEPARTV